MTTPKRPDELALWRAVKAGEYPRKAAERLGIPEKRAAFLCQKWTDRGVYEYGVNVLAGWVDNYSGGNEHSARELELLEPGPSKNAIVITGEQMDLAAKTERGELERRGAAHPAFEIPLTPPPIIRRPIDYWMIHGRPPPVTITIERKLRYEIAPCPRWMKPSTYRWLLARFRQAYEAEWDGKRIRGADRVDVWVGRHLAVWMSAPTLSSDAGAYDVIGAAMELYAEARRRGRAAELVFPTKRRFEVR